MNEPQDRIGSPGQGKGASLPFRAILLLRDPMHLVALAARYLATARHLATARRSECKSMTLIRIRNPEPYRDVSTVYDETVWGSMDEVYEPVAEAAEKGGQDSNQLSPCLLWTLYSCELNAILFRPETNLTMCNSKGTYCHLAQSQLTAVHKYLCQRS